MLIVKLHPLEAQDAFVDFKPRVPGPEVRIVRAYPPTIRLIALPTLVLGMTSVFLLEAAIVGVPTSACRPAGAGGHFLAVHSDQIRSVTESGGCRGLSPMRVRRRSGRERLHWPQPVQRVVAAVYHRPASTPGGVRDDGTFLAATAATYAHWSRDDLDGGWRHWLNDPGVTALYGSGRLSDIGRGECGLLSSTGPSRKPT